MNIASLSVILDYDLLLGWRKATDVALRRLYIIGRVVMNTTQDYEQ
jgi:hypothetical protein